MTARKVGESTGQPKAAGNRGKGRVKGVPNKATASIRDIARQYTDQAIIALVGVLTDESAAARVAAARELLDRGYGKATTTITGTGENGEHIHEVIWRVVDVPGS